MIELDPLADGISSSASNPADVHHLLVGQSKSGGPHTYDEVGGITVIGNPGDGGGGGGAGGGGGYDTNSGAGPAGPSLDGPFTPSAAEKAYADAHIKNQHPERANWKSWEDKMKENLEKLYELAINNPNYPIRTADGHSITAAQLKSDVDNVQIQLTDDINLTGPTGGRDNYGSHTIGINPDSSNMQNYIKYAQSVGQNDYVVYSYIELHEIGHEVNLNHGWAGVVGSNDEEARANSTGAHIADPLSIEELKNPPNGYHD